MAQLWDPRTILDLHPELKGFKCAGTTKKGGRCCQSFISNVNKAQAGQVLRQLSAINIVEQGVDVGFLAQLRNLATCTLCPRWHHGNADQINRTTIKFRQAVERYVVESRAQGGQVQRQNEVPVVQQGEARPQVAAAPRAPPVNRPAPQPRRNHVYVAPAPRPPVVPVNRQPARPQAPAPAPLQQQPNHKAREQAELEERFLAAFGWPFQQDPATARILLAQQQAAQQELERGFARIRAEREVAGLQARVAAAQHPAVNFPVPPRAPAPAPRPTVNAQQLPPRAPRPYGPPAPAVQARALRPYGPAIVPQRIVHRRPIDEECFVCMEAINSPQDAVWCKGECGKNLHLVCFAQWARGKMQGEVKCGHCRAPWVWD
ncbi:uncharacterized protein PAC_14525 [Phialocephala subalpina]|uniref:RING-type domain-containing protein n=1 Tax=Phialocephala subalpina TaxID=576137 RepID=A0A1L7XI42_9HELO|nr:uncharacterized protein PAC_14525 [Phialocephala subalpina]